jgi:peptide/nickel transport system substrate-binding protein
VNESPSGTEDDEIQANSHGSYCKERVIEMNDDRFSLAAVTRRRLLTTGAAGLGLAAAGFSPFRAGASPLLLPAGQTPQALVDEVVIDLGSEPATLDPATTYEVDGWSIVHSIYDSLVQYGVDGQLEWLLAESWTQVDPTTVEIKLRSGIAFHNGEAFDASSLITTLNHIVDPKTASSIAGNFAPITKVSHVDPLTARLTLSQPAPWLPAQVAAWFAVLPPAYAAANDFTQKPVGTGPYSFVEWVAGDHITLEANPNYALAAVKGQPIARRVTFRFVSEPATRVSDLLAGTAGIVRDVPVDQMQAVEDGGAKVMVTPISGTAFIRIPTDVAPYADPRVRKALNLAVDVQSIIDALLAGKATRQANFFVPGGLGYDPNLAPYPFDPDQAKSLLADAGYADGFETAIAYAATERADVVEAIAAQLSDVGIKTTAQRVEVATFNQQWTDQSAAPLRYASWRPMFDPYTLLSLIVADKGYLSRHNNPKAQTLIDAAAIETDPTKRAADYQQLGQVLFDEPAAIYLWSLTSLYGVGASVPPWTTRADDYIIPTNRT